MRIDWGELAQSIVPQFVQPQVPPIFSGDRLVIFAFLKETEAQYLREFKVALSATTGTQQFTFPISVTLNESTRKEGTVLHRLAALQAISNLEKSKEILDAEVVKKQSIQLAKR